MQRFLLKRILSSVITLLVFTSMIFFLANIMIPGDITTNFMPGLGDQRAVLQERFGLNQPLWAQYLTFMQAFVTGNLGTSGFGQPISEIMAQLLPYTLLIFVFSVGIAFVIGHWLGRVTAWTKRPVLKHFIRFSAVTAHSMFPPFLTFFLAYLVSNALGPKLWGASQRIEGAGNFNVSFGRNLISSPSGQTGTLWMMIVTFIVMAVVVALLQKVTLRLLRRRIHGLIQLILFLTGNVWVWRQLGQQSRALDLLFLLSMPLVAVTILAFGEIALVVEAAMDGAAGEQFIQTARAKGLPERAVRDRHAARVALLPALSKFVTSLPFVLTGLVIVEFAFTVPVGYAASLRFPGLSTVLFNALTARDYSLVIGGLLVIGLISIGARIVIDLLHMYLDPRVAYGDKDPVQL